MKVQSFLVPLLLASAAGLGAPQARAASSAGDGVSTGPVSVTVPARPAPLARSLSLLPGGAPPDAELAPSRLAEPKARAELRSWNESAASPKKFGFERTLQVPLVVRFDAGGRLGTLATGAGRSSLASDGAFVWVGAVRVAEAVALRLHLTQVDLPVGTRLRVFGDGQAPPREFDPAAVSVKGEIWAPRVEGETVRVEVEIPPGAAVRGGFVIPGALEIVSPVDAALASPESAVSPSPEGTECLINGECASTANFPAIDYVRRAVAHLEFVVDGTGYICSGTLLNDTASSLTPYLLTANHCFASSPSAASLEAYFDYRYSSCGSTADPGPYGLPATFGSTLLSSGSDGDYTLVRLSAMPSGTRYLLGWNSGTSAVGAGTNLYRVSYPMGKPQHYSRTTVASTSSACTGWPTSNHLYENLGDGTTQGGSSGSAVTLSNGQVVGQLSGKCGTNLSDVCSVLNYTSDGAFFYTFSAMRSFLDPQGAGCTPSDTVVCLYGGRFQVQASYMDYGGNTGSGHASKLTDDTGQFWFFSASNVELFTKFVSFCGSGSNNFGLYANGLTDLSVTINVTDTKYGTQVQHTNALGNDFRLIKDGSFRCP